MTAAPIPPAEATGGFEPPPSAAEAIKRRKEVAWNRSSRLTTTSGKFASHGAFELRHNQKFPVNHQGRFQTTAIGSRGCRETENSEMGKCFCQKPTKTAKIRSFEAPAAPGRPFEPTQKQRQKTINERSEEISKGAAEMVEDKKESDKRFVEEWFKLTDQQCERLKSSTKTTKIRSFEAPAAPGRPCKPTQKSYQKTINERSEEISKRAAETVKDKKESDKRFVEEWFKQTDQQCERLKSYERSTKRKDSFEETEKQRMDKRFVEEWCSKNANPPTARIKHAQKTNPPTAHTECLFRDATDPNTSTECPIQDSTIPTACVEHATNVNPPTAHANNINPSTAHTEHLFQDATIPNTSTECHTPDDAIPTA
jgi:hypothetical protein